MTPTFEGLLVLDKPQGITSRDAVDQALRWFPRRTRLGHTGTLDPLATGVLVLCLGSATRLAEYVQRMSKTYRSVFRLGESSDSDDADGTITKVASARDPGLDSVRQALSRFIGTIDQVPPKYSAAHVTGKRAYDLARRGEEVQLQPRPVQVYAIDILRYDYPELEVEVRCGKGTYIRSLARDLGLALGCGGHVATLRRTRVGPFTVEDAVDLSATAEQARQRLRPMALALAELPRIVLPEKDIQRLGQGQEVALPAGPTSAEEVAVIAEDERLLIVARVEVGRKGLRAVKVIRRNA